MARLPEDDDGRTIADMSGVAGRELEVPGRSTLRDELDQHWEDTRDVREELGDPEDRLMVILGTLKAALSIGLVYVLGFGIAIALMLFFWT